MEALGFFREKEPYNTARTLTDLADTYRPRRAAVSGAAADRRGHRRAPVQDAHTTSSTFGPLLIQLRQRVRRPARVTRT